MLSIIRQHRFYQPIRQYLRQVHIPVNPSVKKNKVNDNDAIDAIFYMLPPINQTNPYYHHNINHTQSILPNISTQVPNISTQVPNISTQIPSSLPHDFYDSDSLLDDFDLSYDD